MGITSESREFMPEIRRVSSVSGDATPCTWQVGTDSGTNSLILNGACGANGLANDGRDGSPSRPVMRGECFSE